MRGKHRKWSAASGIAGGLMVAIVGGLAFAQIVGGNGPYAYEFTVGGNGNVACTTQTRTASETLAPEIYMELTAVIPKTSGYSGNFTAANTNCQALTGFQEVTDTEGYQYVYANDYVGNHIKLIGGTALYQAQSEFEGNWET